MATIAEAARIVADELNFNPARAQHIARRLQDAGILPVGSGAAVPHIDFDGLAALMIAIAIDGPTRAAPEAVETYSALWRSGVEPDILPRSLREHSEPFGMFLSAVVLEGLACGSGNERADLSRLRVEFVSSWPEIVIGEHGNRDVVFHDQSALRGHWQNDAIRRSTSITGRALERIVGRIDPKR